MTETSLIDRYFTAAVDPELETYFALFGTDATVEDEGREHHGIAEIRQWRTEVPPVTYEVRSVRSSGSGHDVDAEVAGDFSGSPVRLHFHFEFVDDLISVLRIRP